MAVRAGAVLLALAVALAGALWFIRAKERREVASFCAAMDSQIAAFEEARHIAESTPRIALAPMVTRLQDIKRTTEALGGPEPAAKVRGQVTKAMGDDVERLVSFMGQDTFSAFTLGRDSIADWERAKAYLADLRESGRTIQGRNSQALEAKEAAVKREAEEAASRRETQDNQNADSVNIVSFFVHRTDEEATFYGELLNRGTSLASTPAIDLRCADGEREFRISDIQPGAVMKYREQVDSPGGKGPCWLKVKGSAHVVPEEIQQ